jgi:serine/threonine-protein kinase
MAERASRAERAQKGAARRCPTCGARYPLDFRVCPKDATSLELAGDDDDPLIGEVLAGSFMITRMVGEGGMGRVYEAEHVRLPRHFAVKVMLERLSVRPDAVARFEREAQAVARIESPHVLDVVDVLRVQGRPCMVTELLAGEELADVLDRQGKLPLSTAVALCRQVCRGLTAAHAVGVVHRDLKPSNLFLMDRDAGVPFVKILDFGVAKIADGAQLTRTGMILGTPAYMAPEQAQGATDVDARADVYAVGAVLYHMLTGQPPFVDQEPSVILARVLTQDPRRPRDLDRSIPETIEALIQRAMARDPQQRPATIQELDRLLASVDGAARAEGSPSAAPADRVVVGAADTVVMASPPGEASEIARRARRARPAAFAWTVLYSLFAAAGVIVASATILRIVVRRAKLTETEVALLGAASVVTLVLLFLGGSRALVSRWRSAPAVERLGAGLRAALLWFVVPLGALTLGARAEALFGPALPQDIAPALEIGVLAVPIVLGQLAFTIALWRARRS